MNEAMRPSSQDGQVNEKTVAGDRDRSTGVAPRNLDHLFRGSTAPVAPTVRELGERLGKLRREVGHDVAEVARRCGVDQADVEGLEHDGSISAVALLAIITRYSWSWRLDEAFLAPRLDSVDEMVEFERRCR